MRRLLSSFRFAARRIRREPKVALLVVMVLAVGIGSSTAVFRWVDAVLFRPLPVREQESLVRLYASTAEFPERLSTVSHPAYRILAENAEGVAGLAAVSHGNALQVAGEGIEPARVEGALVSGSYFSVLGIRPARGRLLGPSDDRPGARPAAVLSHRFWKTRLGEDPGILERSLTVNGHPFEVVGVAPPEFSGDSLDAAPDLWLTLATVDLALPVFRSFDVLENDGFVWLGLVGRREPGSRIAGIEAELGALLGGAGIDLPSGGRVRAVPLAEAPVHPEDFAPIERASWILLAVLGLVFGLGCAVAASLLLVRGERRRRDLAVRRSLGAARSVLAGEVLAEGLLLAAAAGILGIAFAAALDRIAIATWGSSLLVPTQALEPLLGSRMLLATLAATALTALFGALYPAVRATSVDPAEVLKASSNRSSAAEDPFRSALVVSQVALSTVLLVGAGLLLRTLDRVQSRDPGFPTENGIVASVDLARQGYEESEWAQTFARIEGAIAAVPGIEAVGLAQHVPVHRGGSRITVAPEGYEPSKGEDLGVHLTVTSPGFLETLGARLVEGRLLRPEDRASSAASVVVNQAFVDRFWPGQRGVGKTIDDFGGERVTVVGVVEDFKLRSLREDPVPAAFAPDGGFPASSMTVLARTRGEASARIADLRRAVASVDPHLPLYDVASLEDHTGATLQSERGLARLLAGFGVVAVGLALCGLYGILAFVTECRRREIGVRMAIGARRAQIVRSVMGRGIALGIAGVSIGVLLSLALGRFLGSLLFEIAPHDPPTFASVVALLTGVSAAAAGIPARRAARVDPMTVLREE